MARRLAPWPKGLQVDAADAGEFADAINALGKTEQSPPWCSYVLLDEGRPVAMGGFKAPPDEYGSVEIGYLTFEPVRGRGFATDLARGLVEIAGQEGLARVIGDTEPRDNASTAILRKLGFVRAGSVIDDDIGEAWRWELELG